MVDWLGIVHRRHIVHALVEVDVTEARRLIHAFRAHTGRPLSFTAFATACLAKAIDEHKEMHALRKGRRRLVVFEDVDIALAVEHELDGEKIPLGFVIRAANRKSAAEIDREIRDAQTGGSAEYRTIVRWLPYWLHLPGPFRQVLWERVLGSPRLRKRIRGTAAISALSMFGSASGWGIPMVDYTLALTLGGVAEKPAVVHGEVAVREILCLTISVDHDLVDGAPATRFIRRLMTLIEDAHGLPDPGAPCVAPKASAHRFGPSS
jgi:pyruvate/2-oxoglutarate dehydrogenase complex dihydrolipoamide acyltransferase (E2) component